MVSPRGCATSNPVVVTVLFDYDADPERYRLGMHVTQAHSSVSLYDRVAALLGELSFGRGRAV